MCICAVVFFLDVGGMILRAYKYWLEYDLVALVFLIIGMAAVGLFALII